MLNFLAEREGFEPSVEVSSYTRLAGERLQPARPSLRDPALNFVAEGVGFEPTSRLRETVFKTAALNHSAIPPHQYEQWVEGMSRDTHFPLL